MDVEKQQPIIVTTSKLLTTGVDVPTCQNIAIVRVIRALTEFKQIIGRGTRVRDDYNKLFFNILDYTGCATVLFQDADFDGFPALITEVVMDDEGNVTDEATIADSDPTAPDIDAPVIPDLTDPIFERSKYYVDEGKAEIAGEVVYRLDENGNRLEVVSYTDYTAEQVRTMYASSAEIRNQWANPEERASIIEQLAKQGIDFGYLAEVTGQPEADPFDLPTNGAS